MQRLPADYYASPVSEVTPLFPRWVPLGCGIAHRGNKIIQLAIHDPIDRLAHDLVLSAHFAADAYEWTS